MQPGEHDEKKDRYFANTWKVLAQQGKCDVYEGEEYGRVFGEWRAAGRPVPAEPFIIERANVTAAVPAEQPAERPVAPAPRK